MMIVDRIEEDIVVCENSDRSLARWSIGMFPEGIREGDVVEQTEDGFLINEEETLRRKQRIEDRFRKLQK